jgi:hypothetical protein
MPSKSIEEFGPFKAVTTPRRKEYMAEAARASRARKWLYSRQQAGLKIPKDAPQWAQAGFTPGAKLIGEYIGDRLYITA